MWAQARVLTVAWNGFRTKHMVVGYAVVLEDHGGLSSMGTGRTCGSSSGKSGSGNSKRWTRVSGSIYGVANPPARPALRPAQGELGVQDAARVGQLASSPPGYPSSLHADPSHLQHSLVTFEDEAHRAHRSQSALKARERWWVTHVTHNWSLRMLPPGRLKRLSLLNISSVVSKLTPVPAATNITATNSLRNS